LKTSGLVALGCLSAGSLLGSLASSASLLMASRVIEGIGMGFMGLIAPAALALWFPPTRQGLVMGIWAVWVPVGNLVMFSLSPALAGAYGWQSVWLFGAAYSLVCFVAYALWMRLPAQAAGNSSTAQASRDMRRALASPAIWQLGLVFACFTLALQGVNTFYPTFLVEERSYPLGQAALISSIGTLVVLFAAPLAGWLSDRLGSRRVMLSSAFLVVAGLLTLPFRATGWQIFAYQATSGLIIGAIPTAVFAIAPTLVERPEWAGLGLAVVILGQNLGMLVSPAWFGWLVERLDWVAAGYLMIPMCLVGFAASWRLRIR
jgi:MFS family permease